MAELSFIVGGNGTPLVRITVSETLVAGQFTFELEQIGSGVGGDWLAGDLKGEIRGLFFDVEGSINTTLSFSSAIQVTDGRLGTTTGVVTTGGTADNDVTGIGIKGYSDINMNGAGLPTDGAYDVGVAVGTSGIGAKGDDVQGVAFTLQGLTGITLDDFANQDFGIRIMSIGTVDTDGNFIGSRDGSAKIVGESGDLVTNHAPVADDETNATNEDTTLTVNTADGVLTGDTDVDGDTLTVTQFTVAGDPTVYAVGATAVIAGAGSLTINADGSYSFVPALDFNGSVPVATYTVSDGLLTDTGTLTLTVNPVNDAPVADDETNATNEDTTLTVNAADGVLTGDTDVDGDTLTVTQFTVAGDATVYAAGTTAVIAGAGSLTINADGSYSFVPAPDFNGSVPVATYTVSDGLLTDTGTLTLTVNAVNDAPVNTVPGAQSVNEDTSLAISGISVADVDVNETPGGEVEVTLSALHGSLTLSTVAGLSFSDAQGDHKMVFTGSLTDVNAALATLSYKGDANYNGSDTLTVLTSDQGNTGLGGPLADSDDIAITVNAVNDAPVNTVPGAQSVNEDTSLAVSGISVADVDVNETPGGEIEVTLSALHGSLTLSTVTGLTFSDAQGDHKMVFTGSLTDVNAALATLSYEGDANYNGSDTLTVLTSDQGNTGLGGPLADSDDIAITVNAVNDAPVNMVPATASVDEDTKLTFTGLNTISVADVDVNETPGGKLEVSLSVDNGSLALSTISGLTFSDSDGSDGTLKFQGSLTDVNNALATLSYKGDTDFNGPDTLTVLTSDLGNTGLGGELKDTDAVAITVNAVNDAPVNTVPGPVSTNEDTGKSISGLSISDVDAGGGSLTVTLSVLHGTLTVSGGTAGISGSGTPTVTLTGTMAAINSTLGATVTYAPVANYFGTDTLTMVTNDQGNTGIDPLLTDGPTAEEDKDTVTITVNAINDDPTATNDTIYVSNLTKGIIIPISSLLANDVDIDGLALTVTSVGSATGGVSNLTLNAATGTISFESGNSASGTFTYTLKDSAGGSATGTVTVNIPDTNGKGTVDLSSESYQGSYIQGSSNLDTFTGGIVPDILIGGAANDTLIGGAGDDLIRGGKDNDNINGGISGVDLIDFSDVDTGFTFTLGAGGSGAATINGTDTYSNIDGVIGGAGKDTLTGNIDDNVIRGGGGNDTIDGANGIDLIDFTDGTAGINFTLVQSGSQTTGPDLSAAGLGTDKYSNIEGVIGTNSADTLTGSASNDVIRGGDGNDTIDGKAGDDVITGGVGADILTGDTGSDTYVYRTLVDGKDSITDFDINDPGSGGDKLDISAVLDIGGSTWVDGSSFATAVSDGYLSFTDSGGKVQVLVDIDGSAGAAFAPTLMLSLANVTFTVNTADDLKDNIVLG